jgi:hypothetical protein
MGYRKFSDDLKELATFLSQVLEEGRKRLETSAG